MSKLFCYRWLPRTVIPNIKYMFYTIYYGIRNLLLWFPVIFFNDWVDWCYLTRIMEFQLSLMARRFKKYGHHLSSEKNAKQMLICSLLLKRMREDNYWENCGNKHKKAEQIEEYDQEYLFKLMNKHLKTWWN